tara:strand:+ start:337 stop:528 length:192 start_codon:yes stop_codon:yes gene_type:complete
MSFVNRVERRLDECDKDIDDLWDKVFELFNIVEEHGNHIKELLTDKAYEQSTIKKPKKTTKKK